jgi:hypothetical protein
VLIVDDEHTMRKVTRSLLYLLTIKMQPRPTVQLGDYYGPEPRKLASDAVEDVNPAWSLAETGTV